MTIGKKSLLTVVAAGSIFGEVPTVP